MFSKPLLLCALLCALLLQPLVTSAAYCNGKPKPGAFTNDFPIVDAGLGAPVATVPNGKLFMGGPAGHQFPVVHVWGTAYEMGVAQGLLLKASITAFVNQTLTYIITQAVDSWPSDFFSPAIKALIVEFGIDVALDWNAGVTAPFTPQSFLDEMRGISDASGVDYKSVLRLNMFPELTKASCSFVGAWGPATAAGKVLQVRALDFDMDGPFKDYAQVTVYHPNAGSGHAFASVGWPGQVGALTGMASGQMAVSEIGVSFPDDSFGQGTPDTPAEIVNGKPWMFVLRDVLQYAGSLDEALNNIQHSNRTCNLIIGVGDGKAGAVSGIQYGGRVFRPYADSNLLPVNATWHPQIDGVVYNGMDWLCPGYTSVLGAQLQQYHGSLDAATLVRNVLATTQTGDLHAAVYDLSANLMHVSFARRSTDPVSEPRFAYQRQFVTFDMARLFAEPPPATEQI